MSLWLSGARVAAGVNVLLLLWLGSIWLRAYRTHGARHTLGLLIVGGFLLLENIVWVGLYFLHDDFLGWYQAVEPALQAGVFALCGLETLALLALVGITRQ